MTTKLQNVLDTNVIIMNSKEDKEYTLREVFTSAMEFLLKNMNNREPDFHKHSKFLNTYNDVKFDLYTTEKKLIRCYEVPHDYYASFVNSYKDSSIISYRQDNIWLKYTSSFDVKFDFHIYDYEDDEDDEDNDKLVAETVHRLFNEFLTEYTDKWIRRYIKLYYPKMVYLHERPEKILYMIIHDDHLVYINLHIDKNNRRHYVKLEMYLCRNERGACKKMFDYYQIFHFNDTTKWQRMYQDLRTIPTSMYVKSSSKANDGFELSADLTRTIYDLVYEKLTHTDMGELISKYIKPLSAQKSVQQAGGKQKQKQKPKTKTQTKNQNPKPKTKTQTKNQNPKPKTQNKKSKINHYKNQKMV
jgi:hypothetical protein